ncbi:MULTISPECIES: hypothetical protein [unclassified Saccharicrinis]|uniref:hypothetical protein n=1 Tax=unclassified Saccharicrinis TaxID=2646859 RepID=UPI003D3548AB
MQHLFTSAIVDFENLYNDRFMSFIENRISDVTSLLEQISLIHADYHHQVEKIDAANMDMQHFLKLHNQYLNSVLAYNKKSYPLGSELNSKNEIKQFYSERDQLISKLDKKIRDNEPEENRIPQTDNSPIIKSVKKLKQFRYWTKSLFKKDKTNIQIKKWIPIRHYLTNELYISTFPQLWLHYQQVVSIEIELLEYYSQSFTRINNCIQFNQPVNLEDIKRLLVEILQKCSDTQSTLKGFLDNTKQSIIKVITAKTNHITTQYNQLGTLEAKSLKNSKWYTTKALKKISSKQQKQILAWEISLFSISEDWCFNADLYIVKNKALMAYQSNAIKSSSGRIGTTIAQLQQAKEKIIAIYNHTKSNLGFNKKNKESLLLQSKKITEALSADEFYLSKVNQSQTILYALNELQQVIITEIDNTNDKRMITSKKVEWNQMELSDLSAVYLRELIQFEILPLFSAELDTLKQKVLLQIAGYETEILNLIQISEYNFETITSILDNPESSQSKDNVATLFDEGSVKVTKKLEVITGQLENLQHLIKKGIDQIIETLLNALIELTENEKVGELNIRLLKAKAIRKTTHFKTLALEHLNKMLTKGLSQWSVLQTKGFIITKQLTKIYSQEEVQAQINNEISVFLSDIESSTEKLPFLYQRLFKLEAIEGGYLYFKRAKEIGDFEYIYLNWLKGRFATLAITAEKGAGITSIINYVLKNKNLPTTIINFQQYNNIYQKEEFIFTLSEILDLTPLNEIDLFIDELNNTKGIIVLEGLQFAYLKKVDGFETLKLLFEIMSKTNKSIFWICTCTLHAWNYLNKAIFIEEYFGHVIKLGEFSKDDMVDIVKKRHTVSGYDLVYLKSKADVQNKKMSKLSPVEVQPLLEKQYFQVLNSLAKGNLSVAFIFWLKSIKRIENNTLYISSMNDFNISFIRGLSQEKLFCLYAILLHDGLNLNGFCKVMRYPPEQGRMKLFQMVDDGLLMEINKRYVINLLLYRPTIEALKARNLLH